MALGADISGDWKGQLTTPNGEKAVVQFKFKQDGAKLTGTAIGPDGDPANITEGKVDGETIAFIVEIKMNGGMKIPHSGKISGDSIDMEVHFGDNPPMAFKLTRATS